MSLNVKLCMLAAMLLAVNLDLTSARPHRRHHHRERGPAGRHNPTRERGPAGNRPDSGVMPTPSTDSMDMDQIMVRSSYEIYLNSISLWFLICGEREGRGVGAQNKIQNIRDSLKSTILLFFS